MAAARVLMIGLDGFEPTVAERLIAEGRLPALARIAAEGAHARLDHGDAKRTGLAWEHVSTGLSPESAGRWGVVDFDPATYRVVQQPTATTPFPARLATRTVVFDPPYFSLPDAPEVHGVVNWGAHDPGTHRNSRPGGLAMEIEARFGPYPATRFIYGTTWPSAARTAEAGAALARAVEHRAEIASWLLGERLPDWELGVVVLSEYHSAVEQMWHGLDPAHPLHGLASSGPAKQAVEAVYEAGDRLIARLATQFPDAILVPFNLHGMGPNHSDVASMVLLPELLHRHAFGRAKLRSLHWPRSASGVPLLGEDQAWEHEMDRALRRRGALPVSLRVRLANFALRRRGPGRVSVDWMPTAQYQRHWPTMPAFALPSFYDGRIRINLKGRERDGTIEQRDFHATCDALEALLGASRDLATGVPVIERFERVGDPGHSGATGADITVVWSAATLGIAHPALGSIGPLPMRRTGGHTGGHGAAWFTGPGIAPGAHGVRNAFDVVPTIIELLGETVPDALSGESFAADLQEELRPARAAAHA